MKYKVRLIDDEFIQKKGLNKQKLERKVEVVKSVLNRTPFQCYGVVVAGETRHKWRYCHSVWLGDDLYILKTVYLKKPDTTAYIIAIIEEDRSGSDRHVHDVGDNGDSGTSLLG